MITMIPCSKLHPHPDNPRKNLGDLTELAESIKSSGVLQNLTVVPWFSKITGVGCDDPQDQEEMGYTVVIGHRRLAAAKQAGLSELPCVITDMSLREQVATMLLENMQRSDLTVYEQAQGFQMMMDLGENITSISDKTGFSESTVRRRVNLLALDKEKFAKSVERGATLMDFAKLDEIKDLDRRNEVLDSIGTQNFAYKLKSALDAEKAEANRDRWKERLSEFASELPDDVSTRHVCTYYPADDPDTKLKRPEDADSVKYYYRIGTYNISLVKENVMTEAEYDQEKIFNAMRERDEKLYELTKRAYELRRDFILNFRSSKKHLATIARFWMRVKIVQADEWNSLDDALFAEAMGIVDDNGDYELSYSAVEEQIVASPERAFLIAAYCDCDDGARERYHNTSWHKWPEYTENGLLDAIYAGLEELGYKLSDEERLWMTGEHELFSPPNEDEMREPDTEAAEE